MTSQIISDGEWLAVSTKGFAEQQKGRPLAHVLKELIQNGLDAIGDRANGEIRLIAERRMQDGNPILEIDYADNGTGAESLRDLNVVFLTSKKDTVKQRGRMGRGFKELLSLATSASVVSRNSKLTFGYNAKGRPIVTLDEMTVPYDGFAAHMTIAHAEAHDDFAAYFESFIVPKNIRFTFTEADRKHIIAAREPKHVIPATLTTERFVEGRWLKPNINTVIELYETTASETALIYEMGIPVCPVEWPQPFHVNVQQRVPMNPSRDAVMSGYPDKLHRAALPTLLKEMTADQTRESWVGDAAAQINDPELQKAVVQKAFGENIARSTPAFGRFSHDDDATEKTEAVILHTSQLTGGFKKLVTEHVPSSKQVVEEYQAQAVEKSRLRYTIADIRGLDPNHPKNETEREVIAIGIEQVTATLGFAEKFCNELLAKIDPEAKLPQPGVAILQNAWATWNIEDALTLDLSTRTRALWNPTITPELMETLIHEVGHRFAFHHGKSFHSIIERLAGQAAAMLLTDPSYTGKIIPDEPKQNRPRLSA